MRRPDMVRAVRPRLYRRLVLTGGIGVLFLGLLAQRLQSVDADRVVAAMAGERSRPTFRPFGLRAAIFENISPDPTAISRTRVPSAILVSSRARRWAFSWNR